MTELEYLELIANRLQEIHILLYFFVTVGFGSLIVYFILRPLWFFIGR